jgi:hypothetical protein
MRKDGVRMDRERGPKQQGMYMPFEEGEKLCDKLRDKYPKLALAELY